MSIQMTKENIQKQAIKTEQNARNSVNTIGELEEQIEAAGQKYVTLQKIKAYIADLCDMLQVSCNVIIPLSKYLIS